MHINNFLNFTSARFYNWLALAYCHLFSFFKVEINDYVLDSLTCSLDPLCFFRLIPYAGDDLYRNVLIVLLRLLCLGFLIKQRNTSIR